MSKFIWSNFSFRRCELCDKPKRCFCFKLCVFSFSSSISFILRHRLLFVRIRSFRCCQLPRRVRQNSGAQRCLQCSDVIVCTVCTHIVTVIDPSYGSHQSIPFVSFRRDSTRVQVHNNHHTFCVFFYLQLVFISHLRKANICATIE